VTTSDHVELP